MVWPWVVFSLTLSAIVSRIRQPQLTVAPFLSELPLIAFSAPHSQRHSQCRIPGAAWCEIPSTVNLPKVRPVKSIRLAMHLFYYFVAFTTNMATTTSFGLLARRET